MIKQVISYIHNVAIQYPRHINILIYVLTIILENHFAEKSYIYV